MSDIAENIDRDFYNKRLGEMKSGQFPMEMAIINWLLDPETKDRSTKITAIRDYKAYLGEQVQAFIRPGASFDANDARHVVNEILDFYKWAVANPKSGLEAEKNQNPSAMSAAYKLALKLNDQEAMKRLEEAAKDIDVQHHDTTYTDALKRDLAEQKDRGGERGGKVVAQTHNSTGEYQKATSQTLIPTSPSPRNGGGRLRTVAIALPPEQSGSSSALQTLIAQVKSDTPQDNFVGTPDDILRPTFGDNAEWQRSYSQIKEEGAQKAVEALGCPGTTLTQLRQLHYAIRTGQVDGSSLTLDQKLQLDRASGVGTRPGNTILTARESLDSMAKGLEHLEKTDAKLWGVKSRGISTGPN